MSFDRLPLDADHLVAHMQPQVHRPELPSNDDDHSSNASQAPSSQDPYYSNDDIATLHAVVAAAQQLLDSSAEPKPLPAAALFKAYDAVLPDYGVDPDTDHHLSAFVFRIGGERGDGNLVDKFQAILSRMGIVLEFGDNTSGSSRHSPETSPGFNSSSPRAYDPEAQEADQTTGEMHVPKSPILATTTSPRNAPPHENQFSHSVSAENEAARRAALSAVMGRWRSLALKQRERLAHNEATNKPTVNKGPATSDMGEALSQGDLHRESRDVPTSAALEEEPESQLPAKQSIINQNLHQDSLRSLLDNPPPPDRNLGSLPDNHLQGNKHVEWPLQSEKRVPQVGQQPPVKHNEERGLQGTFLPPLHHEQEPVPLRVVSETKVVDETEEQDLSQRPPTAIKQVEANPPQHTPTQTQREANTAELEARHEKRLKHASRARELYLASKVFNHWADRTARRLERDAVARRHMIRFRCFKTWSQAPAYREPTADHMRSVVTVKKWNRIATQNENLEAIAERAAEAYRLKTMQQVLAQWSCHRLQHVGRDMTASRSRTKAVSKWMAQASTNLALSADIRAQTRHGCELHALDMWQSHTHEDIMRIRASRRIGALQQSFTHLRDWWDQTEIRRRAAAYRQHLLAREACFLFDQWNLQARAQAFIWRREYVSVTRVFDAWCRSADEREEMQRKARAYYENRTKSELVRRLRHVHDESSQLSHLENRANFYIRRTRLMSVFTRVVQQRRVEDKEHVKRYLMARYTEMSSARKKRNFFAALDKWRAFTRQDQEQTRLASELSLRKQSQRQIVVLQLWSEEARRDRQRTREARIHHGQGWLEAWRGFAGDLEQRDMEAWQLWAVERQRNCLKEWSISSLQQSGQAHTASEVHKKHNRERRNRYLQSWRQLGSRPRSHIPDFDTQRMSTTQAPGSYRASWIALSGRRSVVRRNDKVQDFPTSPVETPTRWTGQPIMMSGILAGSTMAPVREANEDDGASSTTADDLGLTTSPSKRPQERRANRFPVLSSTTPRAPVPLHLDFQERPSEPDSISMSNMGQPSQPRPSGIPQRGTPSFSLQPELARPDNLEPQAYLLRPSAPIKPFGYRPANERSMGLQPPSQPLSRGVASKSVGGRPSGLRYGVSQSSRLSPPASVVRFQSPKSFSVRSQLPTVAPTLEVSRNG